LWQRSEVFWSNSTNVCAALTAIATDGINGVRNTVAALCVVP
jgi:hypothetical protein